MLINVGFKNIFTNFLFSSRQNSNQQKLPQKASWRFLKEKIKPDDYVTNVTVKRLLTSANFNILYFTFFLFIRICCSVNRTNLTEIKYIFFQMTLLHDIIPKCKVLDFRSYFRTNMRRDMTKPTKWLCVQRRLRSAWASAQSDHSFRCLHEEILGP